MNTVFGIPYRELAVIGLNTGSAVILLFEQFRDFFNRLLLLKSGGNHYSCIFGVARQTEYIVNIALGKRKSGWVYTLRFIYNSYLLLFCREKSNIKEGELSA